MQRPEQPTQCDLPHESPQPDAVAPEPEFTDRWGSTHSGQDYQDLLWRTRASYINSTRLVWSGILTDERITERAAAVFGDIAERHALMTDQLENERFYTSHPHLKQKYASYLVTENPPTDEKGT